MFFACFESASVFVLALSPPPFCPGSVTDCVHLLLVFLFHVSWFFHYGYSLFESAGLWFDFRLRLLFFLSLIKRTLSRRTCVFLVSHVTFSAVSASSGFPRPKKQIQRVGKSLALNYSQEYMNVCVCMVPCEGVGIPSRMCSLEYWAWDGNTPRMGLWIQDKLLTEDPRIHLFSVLLILQRVSGSLEPICENSGGAHGEGHPRRGANQS